MDLVAVIPARSKSKRFKKKNISLLNNKPLLLHSIKFAKKLKFVKKIIFSSDSEEYIKIIKNISNITIHKRTNKASSSKAMEEDILIDMKRDFKNRKIDFPKYILWLRPTHPLRCIKTFNKAFYKFKKYKDSVLVVHKSESRLYKSNGHMLSPINSKLKNRSMIRSQDCKPLYSIFSGEFFYLKRKINKNFLGNKKRFVIAPKLTNFDIDNFDDLEILNRLIKSSRNIYKKYIHV
tara:strand:- start:3 stop:707 length:705 start_codon:yes stop_codon:yes gene_type:complete